MKIVHIVLPSRFCYFSYFCEQMHSHENRCYNVTSHRSYALQVSVKQHGNMTFPFLASLWTGHSF